MAKHILDSALFVEILAIYVYVSQFNSLRPALERLHLQRHSTMSWDADEVLVIYLVADPTTHLAIAKIWGDPGNEICTS